MIFGISFTGAAFVLMPALPSPGHHLCHFYKLRVRKCGFLNSILHLYKEKHHNMADSSHAEYVAHEREAFHKTDYFIPL
jgi:hypothetical protein